MDVYNYNHVNKKYARYKVLSSNVKLSEVQLLSLRETFHALPLFFGERKFYTRTHVNITREW